MRLTIRSLKKLINEALTSTSDLGYRFYHLSKRDLGPEFEFTPRIPVHPLTDENDDVIEDDFTLRTSWAQSVDEALTSLDSHGQLHFIYAVNDLPGEVSTEMTQSDCPRSPDNYYDEHFSKQAWIDWVEENDPNAEETLRCPPRPSTSDVPLVFKNCVPDAHETREFWATQPVVAKRIGYVKNNKVTLE